MYRETLAFGYIYDDACDHPYNMQAFVVVCFVCVGVVFSVWFCAFMFLFAAMMTKFNCWLSLAFFCPLP